METVPLAVAAQRLGWSWWQTREAVLKGRLEGELRNGRWEVSVASIVRQREPAATS